MREITLVTGCIIVVLAVFVPELLFFSQGLLGGDYGQQFFPYSVWYARCIKSFHLPLYTDLVGCGYPLMAEGQTGVFYPVNIVLFFLLPAVIAYQVSTLLHFIIGGVFAYLFMRNRRSSPWASSLFALIFIFGANICGIRYNTVVQKVLVWFPLSLFFIDRFFSMRQYRYLFGMSAAFTMGMLAGFPQIALYSVGFASAYFFLKMSAKPEIKKIRPLAVACLALILALVISSIQLFPTFKAVASSTRAGQGIGFSLWGSSTPLVVLTAFFPRWDYLVEGSVYIGIVLVPFVLLFLRYFVRAPFDMKVFFLLFCVSLILALGSFTPVLPFLIKSAGLSFIRKPSKFLFIGTVFLSACGIWSLDEFVKKGFPDSDRKFLIRAWISLIIILIGLFIAANLVARFLGHDIISWADGYVRDHIFGVPYHRYSLETYYAKVRSIFNEVTTAISFTNIYNWLSVLFALLALIALRFKKYFRVALSTCLVFELFVFAQYATGLKGNFLAWDRFLKKPGYVSFLEKDKTAYRIFNFFTKETEEHFYKDYVLLENTNMIWSVSSIGLYAPIIDKAYYELLEGLGALDDSLGRSCCTKRHLKDQIGLLRALGVKYIFSFEDLNDISVLTKVYSEGDLAVYRLDQSLPEIFFANKIRAVKTENMVLVTMKSPDYNPHDYVIIDRYYRELDNIGYPQHSEFMMVENGPTRITIDVTADIKALMVINKNLIGWNLYLDGKPGLKYTVNAVACAVLIPHGKHRVELRYDPYK